MVSGTGDGAESSSGGGGGVAVLGTISSKVASAMLELKQREKSRLNFQLVYYLPEARK